MLHQGAQVQLWVWPQLMVDNSIIQECDKIPGFRLKKRRLRRLKELENENARIKKLVAVFTGLREGELFGLKWSDLDWGKKHLKVQRQLQRIQGKGMVFTDPKTAAGKRMIVLSTATVAKMREHLDHHQQEWISAGDRWQEYDLLFPSTLGTPMDPSNMYKDFKDTLKMAGLPAIRFHDLRHTAATLMLQQGTHPKIVSSTILR